MSDTGEPLPIFPLSSVVLFPGLRCPLHIFEPRYRQMTARALQSDRRIGMVTVLPQHVAEMSGDPPVFPIGCAGDISEHQLLPDGRYNLLLVGTRRFRIVNELQRGDDRLYRVAQVAFLDDPLEPAAAARLAALRAQVIELARRLVSQIAPGRAAAFSAQQLGSVDDAFLVNALCNALPFAAAEKQGLLECSGIWERCQQLEGLLTFCLAELGQGPRREPSRIH